MGFMCLLLLLCLKLFAMFDQLLLLHRGEIVFQGPATQCSAYFDRLGLRCPPQFNPADFLLDLLAVREESDDEQPITAGTAAAAAAERRLTLSGTTREKQQLLKHGDTLEEGDTAAAMPTAGIISPLVQQRQQPPGREKSAAHILMEIEETDDPGAPHLSHFESHMVQVTVTQDEVDRLPGFYKTSSLCRDVAARIETALKRPEDKQMNKGFQQRLLAHRDFLYASLFIDPPSLLSLSA